MKYCLIIFAIFLSCPSTYAECKSLVCSDGNPVNNTYDRVFEGTLNGNPCLNCLHPGGNCCEWANGDGPLNDIIFVNGNPVTGAQAWQWVLQNIGAGKLQGQVNGDNGIGYFNWSGQDEVNYTFNFDDGKND